MNYDRKISMTVIRRLPKYRRYLKELMNSGIDRISSKDLGEIIGFTASQIRQDFNNFGGFGQQGYGYNVKELYNGITDILALNNRYNTIIIGAGNIGQALSNYPWLKTSGFHIKALFDLNPRLIGLKIHEHEIMDIDMMEEYVEKNDISIAFICTPKDASQKIADRLCKTSIKGLWNFSPIDLSVTDNVVVENVHLNDSLFVLSYLIKAGEPSDDGHQEEIISRIKNEK